MQLGEILDMLYVNGKVVVKVLTINRHGPRFDFTKRMDRMELEDSLFDHDIDPYKVYAVSISSEDNTTVICVDGRDWNFKTWTDYDKERECK